MTPGGRAPPRVAAVVDLGFGDAGKGLFVDALARRFGTRLVVRFNGGAQAGHNVVLPDGRHHTFSQFGAATFQPGVRTLLAAPVVVHPTALLVEAAALAAVGVPDALARLAVDGRCRVTTPYLQAAGRLREWARGAAAHGSCGVGFGETVRHALEAPDEALHYADLLQPGRVRERLLAQRERLRAWAAQVPAPEPAAAGASGHAAWQAERAMLEDPTVGTRWLMHAQALVRQVVPAPPEATGTLLREAPQVLFEGAQGLLLDEDHGFHPHTTWSRCGPSAVRALLAEAGVAAGCQMIGVLRSYLTRHGPGPLPTEDPGLDAQLPEPHNRDGGWQGRFRRGHPDAVLLRHACAVAEGLDALAVSHLDALARPGLSLHWCGRYRIRGPAALPASTDALDRLPRSATPDLAHQARLTAALDAAEPVYDPAPLRGEADLVERVEAAAGLPVRWLSRGPTHRQVQDRGAGGSAA